MKYLIIISANFFLFFCYGQNKVDTLFLNKSECGVKLKKYMYHFIPFHSPRGFSYSIKTKQDSLIFVSLELEEIESLYLIINNKRGNLIFEGPLHYGLIEGNVKYYYNNGKIKSEGKYGYNTGENVIDWIDAPYEIGKWQFYSRNGNVFKEEIYYTLADTEISDNRIHFYRQKKQYILEEKRKKI